VGPCVCPASWVFICSTTSSRSHNTCSTFTLSEPNQVLGACRRWLAPATLLRRLWICSCRSPPTVALSFCPTTRLRSRPVVWCRSSTAARLADPPESSLSAPRASTFLIPPTDSVEWSSTVLVRLWKVSVLSWASTSRSIALSWILPSVWRSQLPSASIRCYHIWSPFNTFGRTGPALPSPAGLDCPPSISAFRTPGPELKRI